MIDQIAAPERLAFGACMPTLEIRQRNYRGVLETFFSLKGWEKLSGEGPDAA